MITLAETFGRTFMDAEAIRAGGVFRICDHCLRDFVGRPSDLFCSRRCRLDSRVSLPRTPDHECTDLDHPARD